MKTCARCGRTYPPDQTFCSQCGLSVPGMRGLGSIASFGPGQASPAIGHVDFLLEQLDEWVKQGWVAPEQARRLYDIYQDRRRHLANPTPAQAAPEAVSTDLPPVPPLAAPRSIPIPNSPSSPRRVSAPAAFFEANNLSFWQLIGALLLLAGLVGLVRWTWGSVGKSLVFALMLGLTCGLFALARSRFVRDQPLTRSVLTAVAALLVPLDIAAVNAFRLLGGPLDTPGIGLLTSLLCLPLYGWIARRVPGRWPAGILAADCAAAVYFVLHALLPPSSAPETQGIVYSAAFSVLTLAYLLAAWRVGQARRDVWRGTAHVSALSALAFALWLGGPGALGAVSASLLLLGLAYGSAAALFDDCNYAFTSQSALTLGGVLALHRLGLGGWITRWYGYVVWEQMVGFASWAAARYLNNRSRTVQANAVRDGGLCLAILAVIAQAARAAFALSSFPKLGLTLSDLGGLLLPAVLSFGYFVLARRRTFAAGLAAYLVVLVGLMTTHLAPVHSVWRDQPNLGLLPAIAALLLWRLKCPRVSLAAGAVGLLLCTIYAALSIFWETTVVALPLLVLAFALHEKQTKNAEALTVWPIAGASVVEVLLLEQRLLPWMQTHRQWEPNYGLGLFALSLAGLALADRRRFPTRLQAALTVAVGTALLELGYAAQGSLPYSPLILLGLGALAAGVIGVLRKLPHAADCALGLIAGFYLAFLLGIFTGHTTANSGREALTASGLLVLSLLSAGLAVRQARPAFVYPAVLAAALGEAHGLHRIWNPSALVYALAFWPPAAVLYAAGLWPSRRPDSAWQFPLLAGASALSLTVLTAATAAVLSSTTPGGLGPLLAMVCLYGALYAAVGAVRQERVYAALAALIFSGAYWLDLLHLTPLLPAPVHAFLLSLGGLVWLALAQGSAWVPRARFAARTLSSAAIGIALAAVLIALVWPIGLDGRFVVYTLLVAGTALLGASRGLFVPWWGQVGVAAYFAAYFAFLTKRLGTPGLPNSDFYLIPAGLYVLALGLSARREVRPNPPAYFLAGLLLTMTPTFIAAWQPLSPPLHALLLLTECVAALFYGIAARVKVFVGAGLAFLIALLLRETQGIVGHIHWAVYATVLGLAILASALFFEKRGAEVRAWAAAARTKLNEWD